MVDGWGQAEAEATNVATEKLALKQVKDVLSKVYADLGEQVRRRRRRRAADRKWPAAVRRPRGV